MNSNNLAFDRASRRRLDENGFLHVDDSHITKATVNPYYGREIPGWEELGLDPERIYYGLRDPKELEKSAALWNGLPLHFEHHVDSADNPRKQTRIGAVGASSWHAPYVNARLTIWDREAIEAIRDGSFRELSCSYRYDPDFTPGTYEGVDYDFVMRNIRGNHVALVEEGRAGHDVLVADAALDGKKEGDGWATAENGKRIHFKDKEIDKGNVGQNGFHHQSTPVESTEPDIGRYQELLRKAQGNHKKAAHEYFREKLQGRHVEAMTGNGPIHAAFTGSGWNEIKKDMAKDAVKAELVPHLPDIITTGSYALEAPAHQHPDVKQFHSFRKVVQTSEGPKEAIVDVAERKESMPKELVYNLTREGSPPYAKRQKGSALSDPIPGRNRGNQKAPIEDSDTVNKNIIAPTCEVVNVRLAEEPAAAVAGDHAAVNKPNLIKGALMRLKKWFRGANDANPEVEKEEVDLAQAIIDLHKVDPNTGEIVDITEDEDKAAEIRKLMGELSSKLEPEELKKLTDAL